MQYIQAYMICFAYMPHFLTIVKEIWYTSLQNTVEHVWHSWKSAQWKSNCTLECKSVCIHTLHIYCPLWVTVGKRPANHSVEHLLIPWKSAQGRLYFSYGHNCNYIYTCTLKLYDDILVLMYDFVKSVCFSRVHHLQPCLLTEVCHRDVAARFDLQVVFWRFHCYRWKCISLMSTADCNDVPDAENKK